MHIPLIISLLGALIASIEGQNATIPDTNVQSTAQSETIPDANAKSTAQSATIPDTNEQSTAQSATIPDSNAQSTAQSATIPDANAQSTAHSATIPDTSAQSTAPVSSNTAPENISKVDSTTEEVNMPKESPRKLNQSNESPGELSKSNVSDSEPIPDTTNVMPEKLLNEAEEEPETGTDETELEESSTDVDPPYVTDPEENEPEESSTESPKNGTILGAAPMNGKPAPGSNSKVESDGEHEDDKKTYAVLKYMLYGTAIIIILILVPLIFLVSRRRSRGDIEFLKLEGSRCFAPIIPGTDPYLQYLLDNGHEQFVGQNERTKELYYRFDGTNTFLMSNYNIINIITGVVLVHSDFHYDQVLNVIVDQKMGRFAPIEQLVYDTVTNRVYGRFLAFAFDKKNDRAALVWPKLNALPEDQRPRPAAFEHLTPTFEKIYRSIYENATQGTKPLPESDQQPAPEKASQSPAPEKVSQSPAKQEPQWSRKEGEIDKTNTAKKSDRTPKSNEPEVTPKSNEPEVAPKSNEQEVTPKSNEPEVGPNQAPVENPLLVSKINFVSMPEDHEKTQRSVITNG